MDYFFKLQLNIVTLFVAMLLPFLYVVLLGAFLKKNIFPVVVNIFFLILGLLLFFLFSFKSILDMFFYEVGGHAIISGLHVISSAQILLTSFYAMSMSASKPSGGKKKSILHVDEVDIIDNLSWKDVVINQSVKNELISVVSLLKSPKTVKKYGITVPKGILLSGPPGNGKTTIAKIIANTTGLSFFTVTSDKLISKWVGDSEKYLSMVFEEAQRAAPSIIFIDEIDTISRTRSEGAERWSENLLNHFLQLLDGIYVKEGIYIIGATNRPDLIDKALKRSGRLDKQIAIELPDKSARKQLFSLYLKPLPLDACVNIDMLAERTEGVSCSDISAICNQCGINAFKREQVSGNIKHSVNVDDLASAINSRMKKKTGLSS